MDFINNLGNDGLYVVNHDDIDAVVGDFESCLKEVENLCSQIDPEETPYESKYKAITLLNKACTKLEATRTIASLEKREISVKEMNWRIAKSQLRLGTLYWECEDLHSAQKELEMALVRIIL